MRDFTKEDLRTGMKIVYRNGNKSIIMLNSESDYDMISIGRGTYNSLNYYNDNLINVRMGSDSSLDIVEVYACSCEISNMFTNFDKIQWKLIWEREEPKVLELTMSEVNQKFGCTCKIIDG